jgi:hypothetical protein
VRGGLPRAHPLSVPSLCVNGRTALAWMSNIGGHGYPYDARRLKFLNEMRTSERRANVFNQLSPRQNPPPALSRTFRQQYTSPGIAPGLGNYSEAVQPSSFWDLGPSPDTQRPATALTPMQFSVSSPNGEQMPSYIPEQTSLIGSERRLNLGPRMATRKLIEEATAARGLPVLSTEAQRAFPSSDPEWVSRMQVGSPHRKPKNETTEFRERIFNIWNSYGVKQPASFR